LKDEFEPKGIKVFPISGVTGAGIKELLYYVSTEIEKLDVAPIIFEPEYFPDEELINLDLPYTVEKDIDKLGDLMIARIEEKRDALGI